MQRSFLFTAATVATAALTTLSAATAQAQAANNLNVGGQLRLTSTSTSGFPLNIDFLSGGSFPPSTVGGTTGNVFSGFVNGAFSGVAPATNGVIQDLTVATNGAAPAVITGGNAASFLTIGGYNFTLGPTPAGVEPPSFTLVDAAGGATANFSVFGLVTGPGFATGTAYQGLFTAQFASQSAASVLAAARTGGTLPVTFSANFGAPVGANVVPEPSTYTLLAAGMGALGLVARRRRNRA